MIAQSHLCQAKNVNFSMQRANSTFFIFFLFLLLQSFSPSLIARTRSTFISYAYKVLFIIPHSTSPLVSTHSAVVLGILGLRMLLLPPEKTRSFYMDQQKVTGLHKKEKVSSPGYLRANKDWHPGWWVGSPVSYRNYSGNLIIVWLEKKKKKITFYLFAFAHQGKTKPAEVEGPHPAPGSSFCHRRGDKSKDDAAAFAIQDSGNGTSASFIFIFGWNN